MAIEVPLNEEISGGERKGGRKEVRSAIRQRRANKGSIRNESEEKKLFKEMLIPT